MDTPSKGAYIKALAMVQHMIRSCVGKIDESRLDNGTVDADKAIALVEEVDEYIDGFFIDGDKEGV